MAVNYGTREVTLDSAAPFTVAAGDLLRLGTYATVKSGSQSTTRLPYYIALADPSNVPIVLDSSDDPKVWGL